MGEFVMHSLSDGPARFATTRWSMVVAAGGDRAAPVRQQALTELYQDYWYPLYAFIRRHGHAPAAAQDLTQSFFLYLLEEDVLGSADPARGRFRSFLITVLKRFLGHCREREQAQKRGGGRIHLSLDFASGEQRLAEEPATHWTPEREFARRWALTLLAQVLEHLRQEYVQRDRGELFQKLQGFLTGEPDLPSYDSLAAELSMTAGAAKVAVHRLRQRYRERLREEVSRTVEQEADVDDELRDLIEALRDASGN